MESVQIRNSRSGTSKITKCGHSTLYKPLSPSRAATATSAPAEAPAARVIRTLSEWSLKKVLRCNQGLLKVSNPWVQPHLIHINL